MSCIIFNIVTLNVFHHLVWGVELKVIAKNMLVLAGVECGDDFEYPIVTIFPNNEIGKEKAEIWKRRTPEQVPGVAHHIRVRHVKVVTEDLLSNDNAVLAKIIFD
jgi:hypothetical protein